MYTDILIEVIVALLLYFIWKMEKLALCNDYNTNSFQSY